MKNYEVTPCVRVSYYIGEGEYEIMYCMKGMAQGHIVDEGNLITFKDGGSIYIPDPLRRF